MSTVTTDDLKNEVQQWKRIAAYLASCHAATLQGLPKSASKSSRKRHVDICTHAAEMLRGKRLPPFAHLDTVESDAARCERAAEECK